MGTACTATGNAIAFVPTVSWMQIVAGRIFPNRQGVQEQSVSLVVGAMAFGESLAPLSAGWIMGNYGFAVCAMFMMCACLIGATIMVINFLKERIEYSTHEKLREEILTGLHLELGGGAFGSVDPHAIYMQQQQQMVLLADGTYGLPPQTLDGVLQQLTTSNRLLSVNRNGLMSGGAQYQPQILNPHPLTMSQLHHFEISQLYHPIHLEHHVGYSTAHPKSQSHHHPHNHANSSSRHSLHLGSNGGVLHQRAARPRSSIGGRGGILSAKSLISSMQNNSKYDY
eukprot:GDKJ01057161.1.p1 GENE.GDKJ01057161.1~~GDKJ01057161.1.p1  ORF type:complete len:283 (+),score=58.49 GDKJ01057161.1:37-885(+)